MSGCFAFGDGTAVASHNEQVMRIMDVLDPSGAPREMAEINVLTTIEKDGVMPIQDGEWRDVEFEVALDSGSVVHVCAPEDCPGYKCEESPGSRRGQEFLVGDGGTIPNLGQSKLNLSDQDRNIQSVFQIAAVTRDLLCQWDGFVTKAIRSRSTI